jgi:hypothetical protein
MVMPEGLSGRELAQRLKARKPDLDAELRDVKFLQKPYPPPRLAQVVRECLDH